MGQKLTLVSLIGAIALQGCAQIQASHGPGKLDSDAETVPKNIIMIVSDGMGPAYTTAYRNFADDPETPEVENVVLDDIFVGNASTYPAPVSGYITDSAAAATALATGVKSYNGAIGVNTDKQPVESVLQRAKALGMRTGVAVTSQINHATPAAYLAHNESRQNYDAIADSYFDDRVNGKLVADVMLGGGTRYFERNDRDLVAQFVDAGYEYADSYNHLAAIPKGSNVLGLFAPVGLPPALDDTRPHRLAFLAEQAIKHLENDNGYFLLIEASQVDWAGHSNDIASAMAEMDDLAATLTYLKQYVVEHPDTLVVLTADHSTGGLTIGANGKYEWNPKFLRGINASVPATAKALANESDPLAFAEHALGFALTDKKDTAEITRISQISDADARVQALKHFVDVKTNTGWTTGGHTGVDVELFAFGAGADKFLGQLDNTDIAKQFFRYLSARQMPAKSDEQTSAAQNDNAPCNFKTQWRCQ